jgi:hypothetical protein
LGERLTDPAATTQAGANPPGPPTEYARLTRVILTDEVSRTLFDEYAAHRATDRGAEEIGWQLLGVRAADEAIALATLPAGADRDAGQEHVRFNTDPHAVAYRMLWPAEKRLTNLGVVHTHPGRLRHPSPGDLRGDREWVPRLRGREGVFGIGTADGDGDPEIATRPAPNVQCYGCLRFTWYALAAGDERYHPIPVELTLGPDLAKPLRPVWGVIEAHAARLDRLARQLAGVKFGLASGPGKPALAVTVATAEPGLIVRILLDEKAVRYFYEAGGEVYQADLPAATGPDQGVFLLLAELAVRG